jgi:hypothetical protein
MNRNTALKVLNPVLGTAVLSQVVTGLLSGVLPRSSFELLHQGGGIALAICAALHLGLNWNWVKATYLRRRDRQ